MGKKTLTFVILMLSSVTLNAEPLIALIKLNLECVTNTKGFEKFESGKKIGQLQISLKTKSEQAVKPQNGERVGKVHYDVVQNKVGIFPINQFPHFTVEIPVNSSHTGYAKNGPRYTRVYQSLLAQIWLDNKEVATSLTFENEIPAYWPHDEVVHTTYYNNCAVMEVSYASKK
ncbi:MAG: hypothetical protein HYS98_08335 [Deltaproteobacteria bacterium]|nr:hypothetical protein [Deltaproteobacteria bacterium]